MVHVLLVLVEDPLKAADAGLLAFQTMMMIEELRRRDHLVGAV